MLAARSNSWQQEREKYEQESVRSWVLAGSGSESMGRKGRRTCTPRLLTLCASTLIHWLNQNCYHTSWTALLVPIISFMGFLSLLIRIKDPILFQEGFLLARALYLSLLASNFLMYSPNHHTFSITHSTHYTNSSKCKAAQCNSFP